MRSDTPPLPGGTLEAAKAAQTKANKATRKLGEQATDSAIQNRSPDVADKPYERNVLAQSTGCTRITLRRTSTSAYQAG